MSKRDWGFVRVPAGTPDWMEGEPGHCSDDLARDHEVDAEMEDAARRKAEAARDTGHDGAGVDA